MKALNYTTCQGASIENPLKRGNESKTQPIVAVVDDYYNGHLTLGKKPTVYMVSNQMSGDVYQIACVPGKKKEDDKSSADNGIYMWNVHAGVCN